MIVIKLDDTSWYWTKTSRFKNDEHLKLNVLPEKHVYEV